MKTKLTLNSLIRIAFCAIALAAPALVRADSGTLRNSTTINLSYKAGVADKNGYVAWRTYQLAPGQAHVWNWQGRPLAIMWDYTLGDGKFVPARVDLPMKPRGFLSGFTNYYKNRISLNTSGLGR